MSQQRKVEKTGLLWALLALVQLTRAQQSPFTNCKYAERGSLTAICTNATVSTFHATIYNFDHLDETLICSGCTLTHLITGTFDIGGNRIQVLDLANSAIETIEAHAFTGLIFMEKLYLSNNSIHHLERGAFHGARKVKKLYMNQALTAPLPPFVFHGLLLLTDLLLQNNSLPLLETQTFEGLPNLRNLDLRFNSLRELNNSLNSLRNLEVLLLSNNQLAKISPTDLHGLSKLLKVDLSHNFISTLNLNLGQPNSLKKLNLSNSHVGSDLIKLGVFHGLYSLEILDLSLNWIVTLPKQVFQELHSLREAILSHNALTEFATGSFSGLPYLRFINASHNKIKRAFIAGKLQLHNLQVLDLSTNNMVDFDLLAFLRQAPLISKVDLRDNMISCPKLRRITTGFKNSSVHAATDPMNCSELDAGEEDELLKEISEELNNVPTSKTGIIALKITMLLVVIVLIGLLVYVQFFILNRR
ncbi:insulin-like growth factor-binding protein complex acid labile subunit [Dendroctonus ponderosae]|uniref:LRRCT domain-containing protein n=1 Tax=Dendroctonus ponderosae TaxID=77166 RepID=U4U6A3_DENPD|nr:insulin-like growth factor-binding protein complex acid labile subunit [Dendroctonus ponderosae]ERL88612.1 hypothetical protein D910_05997 [Dendroctonus ponderosae]KAH1006165.1 hypothetical protein HUJ05_006929 [Dendroctonus ponderosae]